MKLFSSLYPFLRFFLFLSDPEILHEKVGLLLRVRHFLRRWLPYKSTARTQFAGKPLFSSVGIAAGYDKYGKLFPALMDLGFATVETGTFTPYPQNGNPRPRILRLPSEHAIVNKMGFNNPGIEKGWKEIKKGLRKIPPNAAIGISIGKGKDTSLENAVDDYKFCLDVIQSDLLPEEEKKILYIAINISSPNTPELRKLQSRGYIGDLVRKVVKVSQFPVLVKLAPDFDTDEEFTQAIESIISNGAYGIIISNTTVNYADAGKKADAAKNFGGGLSGKPLRERAEYLLQLARNAAGPDIPLISSGGVMSPQDIQKRLSMGANLVQVYSGFIYFGPSIAHY